MIRIEQFRCVRCRKAKAANLVATLDGDWSQTICNRCYEHLISADRAKPAQHRRSSAQGSRQQAKKPAKKPTKNTGRAATRLQPIGMKERRRLEQRLPGLERMLSFFRAAEVEVELLTGGHLLINGRRTGQLDVILPRRERLDWNSMVDEMALDYAGERFAHALSENACFHEHLRAFLRRRETGFEIRRDEVRLALIHATRAEIPHRKPIHANFLTPGSHWEHLAAAVHEVEPHLVAEWQHHQETRAAAAAAAAAQAAAEAAEAAERARASARRRLDAFPDGIPAELEEACLDASRRIRHERQVAYERPVVLESAHGELALLPIAGRGSRLVVPFRLKNRVETLIGELVLVDRDPLPLLVPPDMRDEDALQVWTCALLGFAAATCIDPDWAEPPESDQRRGAQPRAAARRSSGSSRWNGGASRPVPRHRLWPPGLEPIGHWVRYSGALVAGHRRRLFDGRSASADARDRARQVGITLRANETWVRPHTHGVPDGIEMRFRWAAPTALKLSSRA